jgi:predicted enzyme related to lactoylglutathione lyase
MSSERRACLERQVSQARSHPVVHLELRTPNLPRGYGFYARMFGWPAETVHAGSRSYLWLDMGDSVQGGVAESESEPAIWLPYVAVPDVHEATERAVELGAAASLEPREGPTGWRSVVVPPSGAEVGLWQPK